MWSLLQNYIITQFSTDLPSTTLEGLRYRGINMVNSYKLYKVDSLKAEKCRSQFITLCILTKMS